ncbi:MAG TPA: hypothetical protein VGK67_18590 [Myxococcales bacterium]
MKPPAGQRLALGLLLLLPPLVLAAVLLYRATASPAGVGVGAGPTATSRWPNGRPKQSTRDWKEGDRRIQERCGFAEDGAALGCAVLKDGEPWDGVLVDFAGDDPSAQLNEIRRFDRGRRHGTWRSFLPGGEVAVELEYDSDRLVSRKVRGADGTLRPAAEPAARLPGGSLPPKSFPPKRP